MRFGQTAVEASRGEHWRDRRERRGKAECFWSEHLPDAGRLGEPEVPIRAARSRYGITFSPATDVPRVSADITVCPMLTHGAAGERSLAG
jgi:hypothetical protein